MEEEEGYTTNPPEFSATVEGNHIYEHLWSSMDLDQIPVYNLVHDVREDIFTSVNSKTDHFQLRGPQIDSLLVGPILKKCKKKKSYGIVYALLANQVQFIKEASENPLMTSVNTTCAVVCELVAIKILKYFEAQELIDVLTYDFWPLQGSTLSYNDTSFIKTHKISAIEVAIRAEAKRFLSVPVVVQILENIWRGNIVFYSASDKNDFMPESYRKISTIYDRKECSILKLSRLRVPKYRHYMATVSFAVMLTLVTATLIQNMPQVTTLELIMDFWAIGFMLDEIVGISDSGTRLYLLNLWNIFDVILFCIFIGFLALRLYGLFVDDPEYKISRIAYDILATNAIFLFPRLFSTMDHYRYFSQMLIGFRKMAIDFFTTLILILIIFSGFWVALSLAFARDSYSPKSLAFRLMQLFFGFSPAAWDMMGNLNILGQTLLILFMANSNYFVVTVLVSVLSNSFSSVRANAYEEHQFLFAINTISSVKSDAYFFYQTPFNILQWIIYPLSYILSKQNYLKLNQYVIKVTHFPILFIIFLYERFYLRQKTFDAKELILSRTRSIDTIDNDYAGNFSRESRATSSLLKRRYHRDSIAIQMRDRLLDQVFKIPYNTLKNNKKNHLKNSIGNCTLDKWLISPSRTFSPVDKLNENISFSKKENVEQISLDFRKKYPLNSQGHERKYSPASIQTDTNFDFDEFEKNSAQTKINLSNSYLLQKEKKYNILKECSANIDENDFGETLIFTDNEVYDEIEQGSIDINKNIKKYDSFYDNQKQAQHSQKHLIENFQKLKKIEPIKVPSMVKQKSIQPISRVIQNHSCKENFIPANLSNKFENYSDDVYEADESTDIPKPFSQLSYQNKILENEIIKSSYNNFESKIKVQKFNKGSLAFTLLEKLETIENSMKIKVDHLEAIYSISSLSFSPYTSMHLAMTSWDKTLKLFDIKSIISDDNTSSNQNGILFSFEHKAPVLDCCFSSEIHIYTGGLDQRVRKHVNTFNIIDINLFRFDLFASNVSILGLHDNAIKSTLFNKDLNSLITGSWDKTIKQWDFRSNNVSVGVYLQPQKVFSMDSVNYKLVVAMANRIMYIYDLRNMNEPMQQRESSLKFMTRAVKCMPDGNGYVTSSIEGRISVEFFDPSPDIQAKKYAFKCHRLNQDGIDHVYPVNALAFHPIYGTFISGGGDGIVALWDGVAKKRLRQYPKYPAAISSLAFSNDGKYMAIGTSDDCKPIDSENNVNNKIFLREVLEGECKGKMI
ncbi:hypothetical protein PCANB_001595 [Pneumocystis canis]|nr:hypothetical protein PCANB_001595 [Pneumocystis canis]